MSELKYGDAPDCGDNSCLWAAKKGGMRTNGGCRCLRNEPKAVEIYARKRIKELEDKLAEHEKDGLLVYGRKIEVLRKRIAELEAAAAKALNNLEYGSVDCEKPEETLRAVLKREAKGE